MTAAPVPPGLRYYPDSRPGITRRRRGRGFSYVAPDGTRIDCPVERKRLAAMAVPPAYSDVWMSPLPDGHLLATGYDASRRKQYRYHPGWSAARSATKFEGLAEFGAALPRIRGWIARHLRDDPGTRDLAMAVALALLDRASMRPGHPDYVVENGSFGVTTLRPRHLDSSNGTTSLRYRAKGGRKVRKSVPGARLNRVLDRIADLPGAELIVWQDGTGTARPLRSEMLNDHLDQLTGGTATAKTFRTWNGSHAALQAWLDDPQTGISGMALAASERLHNTPAVARRGYIHPRVVQLAEGGEARARAFGKAKQRGHSLLRRGEAELLSLLRG